VYKLPQTFICPKHFVLFAPNIYLPQTFCFICTKHLFAPNILFYLPQTFCFICPIGF
jgi:hypothetical protein